MRWPGQKWIRILQHWSAPLWVRQRVFDADTLEHIARAIAQSERSHSGEIRFAVESALPWSYVWKKLPVRVRAQMVFSKLRVWDTEANNGVLIYLLLAERKVEIVADRGIARQVMQTQWEEICAQMRNHFGAGDFRGGAVAGVQGVGHLLAQHFPVDAVQRPQNELSNFPVLL